MDGEVTMMECESREVARARRTLLRGRNSRMLWRTTSVRRGLLRLDWEWCAKDAIARSDGRRKRFIAMANLFFSGFITTDSMKKSNKNR